MTPFLSLLLPIAVSAVAVFVLSMIIHMTPWHKRDYTRLPDEDGVMKALRAFTIPPNDYAVPHPGSGDYMKSPEYDAKRAGGPVMFVTVLPSGPCGSRHAVLHHVGAVGFLTYAMGAVPMSIWYDRKWSTTFKNAVDSLLYALVTAWIFSMMWPKM